MDESRFINPAGELVPIEGGERAFVPAPLPERVELDERCWKLLARFRESIGRLKGFEPSLGPDGPDDPTILERAIGRREAVHSSSIEGTVVSPEAMAMYDTLPREPEDRLDPANDLREVQNLSRARREGESLAPGGAFSPADVCTLHAMLFDGVRGTRFTPGQLRERQVFIGSSHRFIPPPAETVPSLLEDWASWCARPTDMDPSVRALLAHAQLETIHPFEDGNGRVGRLVLALSASAQLGLTRPWIAPSAAIERAKDEYAERLFVFSAESDTLGWLAFGLERLALACEESFDILRDLVDQGRLWDEVTRDAGMKPRVRALTRHLLGTPYVDIQRAAEVMECAYNTAKSDLEKLVSLGIVIESPQNDRAAFAAPAVIRIVHAR